MNTSVKSKINRLGRIGQIFSILLIVSAIVSCLYYVYSLIDMFVSIRQAAMIENYSVSFYPSALSFCITDICCIVCNLGFVVAYSFLKRAADGFRHCNSPFEDDVIRRMTVFAWVLLGAAILASVFSAATNILMQTPIYALSALLPSFSFAFALIVLAMTKIFRYGAELQKESDETL